MKIALTMDFDIFTVDKEVASIVEKAAHKLELAGVKIDYVHFDFKHSQNDFANLWCKSICVNTAIDMELWKKDGFDIIKNHKDELPEEFIYWNKEALKSSILDYRYFNELRTEILDAQEKVFEDYDKILSPVTICPPVKNTNDGDTKGPSSLNGMTINTLIGFCETYFENFTGNPAASIPAGLTSKGLPVGMQIIGKKFRDEDVFAIAHSYEQINPWNYDIPYNRMQYNKKIF